MGKISILVPGSTNGFFVLGCCDNVPTKNDASSVLSLVALRSGFEAEERETRGRSAVCRVVLGVLVGGGVGGSEGRERKGKGTNRFIALARTAALRRPTHS